MLNLKDIKRLTNQGFTIVELMISTAVFSVVLLIVTAGILAVTHQYYKGITSNNTQVTARTITNQIAQSIQFSPDGGVSSLTNSTDGSSSGYCINGQAYSFMVGSQVTTTVPLGTHQHQHGLIYDPNANCTGATRALNVDTTTTLSGKQLELLAPHMRVAGLSVGLINGNLYQVSVTVTYGDDDLLVPSVKGIPDGSINWPKEQCASITGDDFCSVSTLTTTVDQRL